MKWMESLWESVSNFFAAQFKAVWSGFRDMVVWIPHDMASSGFFDPFFTTEEEWDSWLQGWIDAGLLDEQSAKNIKSLTDLGWPKDTFFAYAAQFMLTGNYLSEMSYSISTDLRHKLYSQERPTDLSPSSLAAAAFIAPEKTSDIRQKMAEAGYSEEKIDYLFLSMYRMYNDDTIRDLFLRGEINTDTMYMRMRELGYTDTRIQEMIRTWELIPPVQDLVRFAYRALFSPETRQKWPWMYEAPAGFVEWTKKQGMSESWAEMYWAAHWVQPGLRETFEMLHRGRIAEDDVKYALEARGFSEYWQDKLVSISYSPYTRVDVRRMHDIGILSDEDLIKAYMDLGYDQEHALGMAKFTYQYNQQNNRQLTRSQIENAYETHLISKDDCKALLQEIDYPETEADFLVEQLDWQKQKGYEDRQIKAIGDRYKNNLIDSYEADDKLNKLALDGQRIAILMDEWEIDKFEDRKLPSKSDLEKFFLNDIVNENEYYLEMKKLGYGTGYINWYIQLSKTKKKKE